MTSFMNSPLVEKKLKNCHVEKFHLPMYDNCGEIGNFSTCGKISVQLMGFYCNLCRFVAKSVIHPVLSRNFCHNLRTFMWRKIEPKKYICGEKWQIWGLITWCRTVVQARKSISILFFSWRAFASSIKKISEKALFNGQYEQKVRYAMPCEEIFGFLAINLFSVCLESLLLIFRYNLNLASKEIEHLLSIT